MEWLKRSAEIFSDDGVEAFAAYLLDHPKMENATREGKDLLLELAEAAEPSAMLELGERLLDGRGLAKNREEGLRWLRQAAKEGAEDAKERLRREEDPEP